MDENTAPKYEISPDRARIDWPRVTAWLASSYWSPGISLERVKRGAENSALVLGAYAGYEQVGFLRVVSDKSRFAYICDVWVAEGHRGRGLGRKMVQYALDDPEFATCKWLLATMDAHRVYEKLGFAPIANPERFMSKGRFCDGSQL
jgi:ribosomal protein S18 acetylase RimI-like enzyme